MSAPPASTRPSSISSGPSGSSAASGSGGSMTATPPAACTASTYARERSIASFSQTDQRAVSSAVQMPIRGRRTPVPYPLGTRTMPGMAGPLPMLDTVRLRRGASNGAELRIVLDRPDRMNAWDAQLERDLRAAVELAAADPTVRAVTITGAGRAFSSGADLRAGFDPTPEGHPDVGTALRERYHPIIATVRNMPKPVVAAVNGPAVGIGCSLALACDLVIARESAYLLLAFVNIGLVPDGGSSLLVPSRVGFARAAEMAMLGERVPARQALEWGLINRVVADDGFEAEVDALAERLATGPTTSYAGTKRQLNAWMYARMDDQLALEASIQQAAVTSGDFAEGVQAFLERRPASFSGR